MTDYQAEARRWLESALPLSPWTVDNLVPHLAALLERLCGEKCEAIHPGFAEFRALQKDHRETVAQLAEARAEVDLWMNPELLREEQETNRDWLLREMRDLSGAIRRMRKYIAEHDEEDLRG